MLATEVRQTDHPRSYAINEVWFQSTIVERNFNHVFVLGRERDTLRSARSRRAVLVLLVSNRVFCSP